MIPVRDNVVRHGAPYVTWTLIALCTLIYFWDRQGHFLGSELTFADLSMRPREVVDAFSTSADRFPLVTVFTSQFLHANLTHLLGNMIFLLVFGPSVEQALGGPRYALYYLFWGVAAAAAQVYVEPTAATPMIGASGAIGGVLGAYFLLYPSNKVEIWFPLFFFSSVVSAWVLLGLWFAWQVLVPQQGVANWAHAGGFLAGMSTVLIMGGRSVVLKHRQTQTDPDFEYE